MRGSSQRIPQHWFGLQKGLNLDSRFWQRVADWVRRTGINDLDAAPDDVVRTAIAAQEGNIAAERLSKTLHQGFVTRLRPAEQFAVRRAPVPPVVRPINEGRLERHTQELRIPTIPRHLRIKLPEKA
jgi:hypothetical protein